MSTHTPGPWIEFVDKGETVAILPAMREREVCNFDPPYPARANARLIASAPDLLAACKLFTDAAHEAVRRFNDNGLPCPASIAYAAEQARHAIVRAEGE